MKKASQNKPIITSLFLLSSVFFYGQVILKADGPGNTYELINNVLASGKDAVEAPDISHPSFGRHIAEVYDKELKGYVFEFYSHVTPDNEPVNPSLTDRQRVEIKSYSPSPDNLKGTVGETITYEWKFKIPVGFQVSTGFTHLHQIKAVGGNDNLPLFTLTARKGKPNQLLLMHNNETNVASANLSDFEGVWVHVTQVIKVGTTDGSYSLNIKRVSDGKSLLSYTNDNLMTIRADNNFIRPKWGIYRSLKKVEDLRDETVRFADFSITESSTVK